MLQLWHYTIRLSTAPLCSTGLKIKRSKSRLWVLCVYSSWLVFRIRVHMHHLSANTIVSIEPQNHIITSCKVRV